MAIKPILFNSEMVRAILESRKSCTRRVVKPQQFIGMLPDKCKNGAPEEFLKEKKLMFKPYCDMTDIELINTAYKAPYQPGDILYVRETWEYFECCCCEGDEHGNCYREPQQSALNKSCGCYMYRATDEIYGDARWHPSIHMPKEAARIWLKVTNVRVERLVSVPFPGILFLNTIAKRSIAKTHRIVSVPFPGILFLNPVLYMPDLNWIPKPNCGAKPNPTLE